jgi:hypothetical protein
MSNEDNRTAKVERPANWPAPPADKEANKYTGKGTNYGFHVEVRQRPGGLAEPYVVDPHFVITKDWKRVPVMEMPGGLPGGFRCEGWEWTPHMRDLHLLDYAGACGIAAQLHTQLRQINYVLEFRLVKVKLEYSYYHQEQGVGQPFSFDEFRKEEKWEPRV